MSHQTRHEQLALKVQKDRKKRAKQTKAHTPKNAYERIRLDKRNYNELAD